MLTAPSLKTLRPVVLETWRCSGCRRILAKLRVDDGVVEVRCKCGTMNRFQVRTEKAKPA